MDKCPCCERRFEQITDFPMVKIISMQILNGEQAAEFSAVEHQYWSMDKIRELAKEFNSLLGSSDAVKKFSKTLEDAVGKETRVKDLLPAWVFSVDNIPGAEKYRIAVCEANAYKVDIEKTNPKKEFRITELILFKYDKQLLKIGSIQYEGLLNH